MYRFFTSFRMTRLRSDVILSEAKDLCESITINIGFYCYNILIVFEKEIRKDFHHNS